MTTHATVLKEYVFDDPTLEVAHEIHPKARSTIRRGRKKIANGELAWVVSQMRDHVEFESRVLRHAASNNLARTRVKAPNKVPMSFIIELEARVANLTPATDTACAVTPTAAVGPTPDAVVSAHLAVEKKM